MQSKLVFEPARRVSAPASLALVLGAGLIVAGSAGLPRPAAGQNASDVGMSIYRGDNSQVSGITVGSWGSGTVEADTKVIFSGNQSLKITTQGLYQGARMALGTPADLGPYLTNKYAYLQFVVQIPSLQGPGQGFRGGFPGGRFQGGPPGGFPGGPPGGFPGGFPGRGGPFGTNNAQNQQKTVENLRVVLVTNGDKPIELRLPLASARTQDQWRVLSIPVSAISGLQSGNAQIKEVQLFTDAPTTLWLGQVRVAVDATPITVQPVVEKVIPRNARDTFIGYATGGYTPLKYSWDWDASDGIQEEAVGQAVTHAYYKSGDYTATLTVSDLYGIKPPAKTTFRVHVTP